MSTDDFPMPFSVPHRVQSVGAYSLDIPPEYRIPGGAMVSSIPLPPGRSMVTFTWDGAEGLRYRVERKINGVWQIGEYHSVISPGTAGIPRTSAPISIVSAGVEETSVYIQTRTPQSQASVDVGATGAIDVVTIPPKLAGGGSLRAALRNLLGRWS